MKNNVPFTKIHFDNNAIDVNYNVFVKDVRNGKTICYVPIFDFIFSVNSKDEIQAKGNAMIDSFITWYEEKETFNSFLLKIHSMGFRSPQHNFVMDQLLKKKGLPKADMKVVHKSIPGEFQNSEVIAQSSRVVRKPAA